MSGFSCPGLARRRVLAATDPRMADMERKLAERIDCGAGMLAERQVSPEESARTPNPDRTRGAWFTYEADQLGQGKENARTYLKNNPKMADEIEKRILTKLGVGVVAEGVPDGIDPVTGEVEF